jgi:hypothetical protein
MFKISFDFIEKVLNWAKLHEYNFIIDFILLFQSLVSNFTYFKKLFELQLIS